MPAQLGNQILIRNSKVNYKLSKTEVLDTVSKKRIHIGIKAFIFLSKLVLWSKSSKYENFCFETKTSFKKHGFWSKKFFVSDTSCLEQFADGLKLMNSLNNFKHELKNHFFKKL